MREDMQRESMLRSAAAPAFGFAVVAAVFGLQSLLVLPIFAIMFLASMNFERILNKKREREDDMEGMAGMFRHLYSGITRRILPLQSALGDAIGKTADKNGTAATTFKRIGHRMQLGQDPGTAIEEERRSIAQPELSEMLGRVQNEYSSRLEIANSLKAGYRDESKERRLRKELESGSVNKYLVLSMVTSTILPSLSMFAFVGYSILYYSQLQFLLFSTVLLSVFPGVSGMIRAKIGGIHDG